MLNLLQLFLQYILPKMWLTCLAGWFADKQAGWLTTLVIKFFVKYYKVDMNEAKISNITHYVTFNEFFSRQLRNNVRPLNVDPNILTFPSDGIISQFGKIEDNRLFLVKGNFLTLEMLLNRSDLVQKFCNGIFVIIYLSPRDCHRVYMPCDGILREIIYIPGSLFSVNPSITKNIKNVFTRNERIICLFDTSFGPMLQILVGAIIVGSIEMPWLGILKRKKVVKCWTWSATEKNDFITVLKGQEIGRFKLGSTVIAIFPPNTVNLVETLKNQLSVKIGQPMAITINSVHRI